MRILILNQHPSEKLGGSEMQCGLLATELCERGHTVVYGAIGESASAPPSNARYTVVRVDLSTKLGLSDALRAIKPDVAYWRYNKRRLRFAAGILRSHAVPFVFAVSGIDDLRKYAYRRPPGHGWFRSARNAASCLRQALWSRYNYSALGTAAAITSLNKSYLPLCPHRKSVAIWNATSDVLEPFYWPRSFVVWVANVKAQKRPEAFIRLADKCRLSHPDIDFLMVGSIQQSYYRSVIDRANLDNSSFHYLGSRTPAQVNGILRNALLLVHTCEPEGFGNIFIQAWKQGTATVSLSFDPDSLINDYNLGVVCGDNESSMYSTVVSLLNDEEARTKLGSAAVRLAEEFFTPQRMVDELEPVLLDAAGVAGEENEK